MPNTFNIGPTDPVRWTEMAPRFQFAISAACATFLLMPYRFATKLGVDALQKKPWSTWIAVIAIVCFFFFLVGILPTVYAWLYKIFMSKKITQDENESFSLLMNSLSFDEKVVIVWCLSQNQMSFNVDFLNNRQTSAIAALANKGLMTVTYGIQQPDRIPYLFTEPAWKLLTGQTFQESDLLKSFFADIEQNQNDARSFFKRFW
jgi:hypothetical protein